MLSGMAMVAPHCIMVDYLIQPWFNSEHCAQKAMATSTACNNFSFTLPLLLLHQQFFIIELTLITILLYTLNILLLMSLYQQLAVHC